MRGSPLDLPEGGQGEEQQQTETSRGQTLEAALAAAPCVLLLLCHLLKANLPDCLLYLGLRVDFPPWRKAVEVRNCRRPGRHSSPAPVQIVWSLHSGDTVHRSPGTWRFQFQGPRQSSPLFPKFLSHSFVVVIAFLFGTGLLCIIKSSDSQSEFKSQVPGFKGIAFPYPAHSRACGKTYWNFYLPYSWAE